MDVINFRFGHQITQKKDVGVKILNSKFRNTEQSYNFVEYLIGVGDKRGLCIIPIKNVFQTLYLFLFNVW